MQDTIIQYIEEEILQGQSDIKISADEDLLTTGLIGSLAIMNLIAFLEERFEVQIPAEDMTIEHFLSVDTMVDYLQSRQN